MKTQGSAAWQGGIKDGRGAISTKSGNSRSAESAATSESSRNVASGALKAACRNGPPASVWLIAANPESMKNMRPPCPSIDMWPMRRPVV